MSSNLKKEHEPITIHLNKLEKKFGNNPALLPLTMDIIGGQVTGLVGPDGAGKTTLMRILAGLLLPDGGTVSVAGFDPITQSRELHNHIGYMPQRFGLYEDLPVIENLNLYASLRDVTGEEKEQSYKTLLDFTGLGPFTSRLAGKLSGGMKQKLGLACALLGQPDVLILDEPAVGVDPISRRELWQMVHELTGQGLLVLWSTSYLDEAEQCQNVLLFNEGSLLYSGNPQKLTETMANRCFLATPHNESSRVLLQKTLQLKSISDASIQGSQVRIIIKEGIFPKDIASSLNLPELQPTAARFEDAFIDRLGGAPTGISPLAKLLSIDNPKKDSLPAIEAKNLTKKFGSFIATNDVSFAVKRGEIYGLLGPNGAGKSTTFKMLCGLLQPTSGKTFVLGMDLKKQSSIARQQLGYMAQKFSLYGNLSVQQNLSFFSGIYGLSGKTQQNRIEEMVSVFSLQSYMNSSTGDLPLGYKQRLALACSLMHRPEILFLDEPTSGVDPLTRREFWLHINGMVHQGVTVMVTTHFMDEAEYCDHIGMVYRGKLIASGTPDELKKKIASTDIPDPTMEDAFISTIRNYDTMEKGQ